MVYHILRLSRLHLTFVFRVHPLWGLPKNNTGVLFAGGKVQDLAAMHFMVQNVAKHLRVTGQNFSLFLSGYGRNNMAFVSAVTLQCWWYTIVMVHFVWYKEDQAIYIIFNHWIFRNVLKNCKLISKFHIKISKILSENKKTIVAFFRKKCWTLG